MDGGCNAAAGGAPPKAGGGRSIKETKTCRSKFDSITKYMHESFVQKVIIMHNGHVTQSAHTCFPQKNCRTAVKMRF